MHLQRYILKTHYLLLVWEVEEISISLIHQWLSMEWQSVKSQGLDELEGYLYPITLTLLHCLLHFCALK
jgi:hypothetical protein